MKTEHYRLVTGFGALLLAVFAGQPSTAFGADIAETAGESPSAATSAATPDFHTTQLTWTAEIEPSVWFAALKGDITFRSGDTIEARNIGMDEVHASPMGRFTLRADRWTFAFTGNATSFDDDATSEVGFIAGPFEIAPRRHRARVRSRCRRPPGSTTP